MKNQGRSFFVIAGLVLFAACTDSRASDGDANPTTAVDGAPATTVLAGPTQTTIADITDVVHPPASGDFVGALEDVSSVTCDKEGDGWRVTGIATNPTTDPVDYRIYVSLLNSEATTRALVETELAAVDPGAGATFDERIPIPDNDLRCVLRVERHAMSG